ncbi:MAG TPA: hypothetical protein VH278_16155 [Burkholderiaceae bacterium]|nr:hypothetical protein [Burkholderiaceae bacterium]
MNRFVYLIHAGYQHPGAPVVGPYPGAPSASEKLVQLRAELASYLPDTDAQIQGERIRRDPDVIRLTVVTVLNEALADSAFVRFIQGCKAARQVKEAVAG